MAEEKNKEIIDDKNKTYYETHKEKLLAYQKAWREANKEEIAIKKKAYNKIHKKECAARSKAYRETHKEEYKAYRKAYRETHKEEIASKHKDYKDRKAKELGFENHAQRQRYDIWCKNNSIKPILKNPEYIEKIQWWINNIDNNKEILINDKLKIYQKAYYKSHKEEKTAYDKTYYEKHKEELKAKQKAWREDHKEEAKAYHEQKARELGFENYNQRCRYYRWCKENNIKASIKNPEYLEKIQYWIDNVDNGAIKKLTKEEIAAKDKAYYESNKEEIRARQKTYHKTHKEEIKFQTEQKAQELGFENFAQRKRYNYWCKKNNIRVSDKNSEYLEKIQYWINNIDINRRNIINTKNSDFYIELKARELGFESYNQRREYDTWCKENNIKIGTSNSDYVKNINYWLNVKG